MSRLAFRALVMWDDPRQFEDKEIYDSVHKILSVLLEEKNALSRFELSEYQLMENIVSGSMEAVSEAITNNLAPDSTQELVEILDDLIKLADEIKPGCHH